MSFSSKMHETQYPKQLSYKHSIVKLAILSLKITNIILSHLRAKKLYSHNKIIMHSRTSH